MLYQLSPLFQTSTDSFQVITHKDMSGLKDALQSVVGSAALVDSKADNAGNSLLDRLGDKVLGPTAESETNNAPIIAPDATITPVTQGRRSLRPDGQDPFRSDAPAPADKS
ncbi:hypothetical protein EI94DRAFT_1831156 [Lactarius quietus]|nr:hypothetical protein EI94DRAFT_1831156 [Lactarius quietus]